MTSPAKAHPLRRELHIYPHQLELATRFGDIDPQWHLNNARLTEYYQEGRVSFHRALKDEFEYERVKGSRMQSPLSPHLRDMLASKLLSEQARAR